MSVARKALRRQGLSVDKLRSSKRSEQRVGPATLTTNFWITPLALKQAPFLSVATVGGQYGPPPGSTGSVEIFWRRW